MSAAAPFKEKFLEDNPEYVEFAASTESATIGGFQDIDPLEDELWFVQCPKDVDLSALEGQKMKLPGRSAVVENLEAVAVDFATEPEQHAFGYCNRKGRYAMRLLPVRGSIVLRTRLKANEALTAEQIEASVPPVGRVPAPDCIKVRHPLLGFQFEEKLRLKKGISARLQRADEQSLSVTSAARRERAATRRITVPKPSTKRGSGGRGEVDVEKRKHSQDAEDVSRGTPKKAKKTKSSKQSDLGAVSADLQWLKEF